MGVGKNAEEKESVSVNETESMSEIENVGRIVSVEESVLVKESLVKENVPVKESVPVKENVPVKKNLFVKESVTGNVESCEWVTDAVMIASVMATGRRLIVSMERAWLVSKSRVLETGMVVCLNGR